MVVAACARICVAARGSRAWRLEVRTDDWSAAVPEQRLKAVYPRVCVRYDLFRVSQEVLQRSTRHPDVHASMSADPNYGMWMHNTCPKRALIKHFPNATGGTLNETTIRDIKRYPSWADGYCQNANAKVQDLLNIGFDSAGCSHIIARCPNLSPDQLLDHCAGYDCLIQHFNAMTSRFYVMASKFCVRQAVLPLSDRFYT